MAGVVYLIVTTGKNGGIVAPYVDESKEIVDTIVHTIQGDNPNTKVLWPEWSAEAGAMMDVDTIATTDAESATDPAVVVTFDSNWLKRDCALKCVYEVQVDRDIDSDDDFHIDLHHYQIAFTKNLDDVQIAVWQRIEEEVDFVW